MNKTIIQLTTDDIINKLNDEESNFQLAREILKVLNQKYLEELRTEIGFCIKLMNY